MATTVVNLRREAYDAYIGRGSPFGNPYRIGRDGSREEVIEKYRDWFHQRLSAPGFRRGLYALRGKRLGCYCKPAACHGDVIVEFLEAAAVAAQEVEGA